MMLHATKGCFSAVYGQGSLQCAHNTYFYPSSRRVYPDALPGGVPDARLTHMATDHIGRFAAARIQGPDGQSILLATAFRPVISKC